MNFFFISFQVPPTNWLISANQESQLQHKMAAYTGLSQHIDFGRLPSPKDRFELQDLIGEGTYGEVYSARDKNTGKKVAIKILETIADNLEEIEEEYLVLRDLSQHPNLPSFVGIFLMRGISVEDDQLWFVMEVCVYIYIYMEFIRQEY